MMTDGCGVFLVLLHCCFSATGQFTLTGPNSAPNGTTVTFICTTSPVQAGVVWRETSGSNTISNTYFYSYNTRSCQWIAGSRTSDQYMFDCNSTGVFSLSFPADYSSHHGSVFTCREYNGEGKSNSITISVLECPTGTYGINCSSQCGHCLDDVCHIYTGVCSGRCKNGWTNEKCDDCVRGLYGPNCSSTCWNCLNDEACDTETGICPGGCKTGWTDERCDMEDTNETVPLWVLGLLVGVVLLIIIVAVSVIALQKKKKRHEVHRVSEMYRDTVIPSEDAVVYDEVVVEEQDTEEPRTAESRSGTLQVAGDVSSSTTELVQYKTIRDSEGYEKPIQHCFANASEFEEEDEDTNYVTPAPDIGTQQVQYITPIAGQVNQTLDSTLIDQQSSRDDNCHEIPRETCLAGDSKVDRDEDENTNYVTPAIDIDNLGTATARFQYITAVAEDVNQTSPSTKQ